MGVVFIVLIALAVTSSTMSWLDASDTVRNVGRKLSRNKSRASDAPDSKMLSETATPTLPGTSGPSGEVIAAITVALEVARRTTRSNIPAIAASAAGPSTWAAAGRRRAMERASKVDR